MAESSALFAAQQTSQTIGNIFGLMAAEEYAKSVRAQSRLLAAESEARITRYQGQARNLKAEQAQRYLKSGVSLEGTPLAILEETTLVAAENVNAMRAATKGRRLEMRAAATQARISARMAFVQQGQDATRQAMSLSKLSGDIGVGG